MGMLPNRAEPGRPKKLRRKEHDEVVPPHVEPEWLENMSQYDVLDVENMDTTWRHALEGSKMHW